MRKLMLVILSVVFASVSAVAAGISGAEMGIRKADVFTEKPVMTGGVHYGDAPQGTSERFDRSFENAPPLIPHDIEGLLPIKVDDNKCLGCHLPKNAKMMGLGATPIPKSHFTNYRKHDPKLSKDIYQGRYNCTQCHAPQSDVNALIRNTFDGGFANEMERKHSNLSEKINEGVK